MELPQTNTFIRNDMATENTQVLESEGKARLAHVIMEKAAASHHSTPLTSYIQGSPRTRIGRLVK